MRSRSIPAAVCALLLLTACGDDPAGLVLEDFLGCGTVAGMEVGDSRTGSLDSGDCRTFDDAFIDYYRFRVSGDRTITIRMTSSQVDGFLFLFNDAGALITQNDDFGGLNPQISRRLARGSYVVGASSFGVGESGSYTISVSGS